MSKFLQKIIEIKNWQLALILIALIVVSATFLRLNNTVSIEYRRAVEAADKANDKETLQAALYNLRQHTATHMHADRIPEIQLVNQYQQEAKRRYEQATNDTNKNGNILKKADRVCKAKYAGWSVEYVQCVADEQAKFAPSAELITKIELPDPNLYRHSFVSPVWSNDFAGWSVLATIFIAFIIIFRILQSLFLKILVKIRFKQY